MKELDTAPNSLTSVKIDDFIINFTYDSTSDLLEFTSSRLLTGVDIILLLSNLMALIEEGDRVLVISLVIEMIKRFQSTDVESTDNNGASSIQ